MSVFDRDDTTDTPLTEPHGSALAFLSDLHEQVEMQISQCGDETIRLILIGLSKQIEADGLLIKLSAR